MGWAMIRTVVIGLLSVFIVLMSLIAWDMARMIVDNWAKIRTWRTHPREDREHMAIWLGLPIMKIGLLIFATDALVGLLQDAPMSYRSAARGLAALPFVLSASIIQLWFVYSVRYEGERGDVRWMMALLGSVAFGLLMILVKEFL